MAKFTLWQTWGLQCSWLDDRFGVSCCYFTNSTCVIRKYIRDKNFGYIKAYFNREFLFITMADVRRLCAAFLGFFIIGCFVIIYIRDSLPEYLNHPWTNKTLSALLAVQHMEGTNTSYLISTKPSKGSVSSHKSRMNVSQNAHHQKMPTSSKMRVQETTTSHGVHSTVTTSLSSHPSHSTTIFPRVYSTPRTTMPSFLRHQQYQPYQPRPLTELLENNGKAMVVIHAKLRTGSTFASEFFNKNPEFFYVFEPLVMATVEARDDPSEWIQRTLQCQFDELWHMGLNNPIHKAASLPGWKRKIFCYKYDQSDACALAPMRNIEQNCTAFKAMATKVIRVPSLQELDNLMKSGVKVIHVVRDPRAVVNSRVNILVNVEANMKAFERNVKWAKDYCDMLQIDLNQARNMFGVKSVSSIIPYAMVRYEDLVLDPYGQVEKMYSMTGLTPHPDVYKWIGEFRSGSVPVQNQYANRQPLFSTIRANASSAVDHWRRNMPWTLVNQIQNVCGYAMEKLGYNRLKSSDDLGNKNIATVKDVHIECLYRKCWFIRKRLLLLNNHICYYPKLPLSIFYAYLCIYSPNTIQYIHGMFLSFSLFLY